MIRILNAEPDNYSPDARRILASLGELVEQRLSQTELCRWVSEFDILIIRLGLEVNRDVIAAGHRLRAIVTATTGLDHIDVEFAQDRGMAVLSLRGEEEFLRSVSATAELAWGLLLALLRHIPQAFESVRSGDWDRDLFRGHELNGRRLGIVGMGRLGQKVARYGLAFGMAVAGYDPYIEEWPEGVTHCTTLAELLARTDVLSLHVPFNDETRGLIGRTELALLPPEAVVVNTSRGEVVDEVALVAALESGHLAGAALDVVANERDTAERLASPLLTYARQHDNLLITPHIGGAAVEAMAKTEVFMAKRLAQFLMQR